ncbi:MAG: hypothetical protein ACI80L_002831, partial [Pseudohongiellaceae bacterium]
KEKINRASPLVLGKDATLDKNCCTSFLLETGCLPFFSLTDWDFDLSNKSFIVFNSLWLGKLAAVNTHPLCKNYSKASVEQEIGPIWEYNSE